MNPLVVGIDLATSHVRVTCAGPAGDVVATAAAKGPPRRSPRPGWSEQDAAAWWPAVRSALGHLCAQLGEATRRVEALSVAATSGSVVVVDGQGRPLAPALLYDDQRAADEAARAQEAAPERWIALGLRVSASFGLPKWSWLLAQTGTGPVRHLWHLSDLVVARLTGGPPPTDWSHALKSGYDPAKGEWVAEALAALGVTPELLPQVLPPTSAAGKVSAEAADQTGLPEGVSVRLGMTDGCAGQLAAGAHRPGAFVSVVGTTLVLKGASRELVRDPSGAAYSHRHPDGWWLPGGASNVGGGTLGEWFKGHDLDHLDRRAAARGPARCAVYPLSRRGERFPFVEPAAEEFWVGVPADDTERYRAALEGVAFVERLGYEHLAALGAPAYQPLATAGGGSRSDTWTALRATVLGRPLVVRASADTAFGACVLAAAGTVHPDLAAAASAMVPAGREVEPVAAERDALEDTYGRFLAALGERRWLPPTVSGAT